MDREQGRTDNIRCLEFPRRAGHSVNCISATHSYCEHPEATSVGRVRVYKQWLNQGSMRMVDLYLPVPSLEETGAREWDRTTRTTVKPISHEHSRSGIVLEHDLMDDPRARSPEFYTVFLRCTLQKVKDFLVGGNRTLHANVRWFRSPQRGPPPRRLYLQVCIGSRRCLDQVVTMYAGRNSRPVEPSTHELQSV